MTDPQIRMVSASDGYEIGFRHWHAESPRGIVIGLHGIQSHSGWYEYSSRRLCEAGYSVYFADRRGSGMNVEERGHAVHAERLVQDVRTLRFLALSESVSRNSSGQNQNALPVTLMGISWGGKTAAATAAMFPDEFDYLVLLYPGLVSRLRPSAMQYLRLKLARDFEIVRREIPIPLDDPTLFTASPKWQQFIATDPLAIRTVTSSFLNAGLELDRILVRKAASVTQPVLLMQAGHDRIIDNPGVRRVVCQFASPDLTIRTWPGACHTLEFEDNRDDIFTCLTDWLERVHKSPTDHPLPKHDVTE